MSDHWIVLIPKDPHFLPDEESRKAALAKFAEVAPQSAEIDEIIYDSVQFIDCGGNFERVLCPFCAEEEEEEEEPGEIDTDWWHDIMDQDYSEEDGFQLKKYPVPCCGRSLALNELEYEWPMGFARYALEARNTRIGSLSTQEIAGFEAILKAPLIEILRHI